jgi:uncharacterized membrane protein YjgN (DUF898 family)
MIAVMRFWILIFGEASLRIMFRIWLICGCLLSLLIIRVIIWLVRGGMFSQAQVSCVEKTESYGGTSRLNIK